METNALDVRAYLMDPDSPEDEKVRCLAEMLEYIDLIEAFPQKIIEYPAANCGVFDIS